MQEDERQKSKNYCNFLIMFVFAPLSPIFPPTLGGRVYRNINAVAPGDVVKTTISLWFHHHKESLARDVTLSPFAWMPFEGTAAEN